MEYVAMRKLSLFLVVFALFALMLAPVAAQEDLPTIGEAVVAATEGDAPEFTILLAAVGAADPSILELLTDVEAQLTVFAPTDAAFVAAFEALGVTAEDVLANADLLNAVLAYHVVPSIYDAASLVTASADGATPVYGTLLDNAGLMVASSDMGVMINSATVVTADLNASNGIIHVIDAVLVPDLEALPMVEMEEEPTISIAETVVAAAGADAPEFTTLLAAVAAADPAVLEALTNGGPFTVFAPTDAAFAAALEALGVTAEDILADTDLLTTILAYHVVPGTWSAAGVVGAIGEEGALVGTVLPGTTLSLMLDGDSVMVNDATVIATDIFATNGVVHVIDAVLLPPM
jgi:uncharacterized surface protein with fasciclin (FAS1) repeats